MSSAEVANYYSSVEEYLAAERISLQKHEYLAGVIYAMAGTSLGHDRIANNIVRELGDQLRGKTCEVFSSDVKVRIRNKGAEFYYYPDATADCSRADDRAFFAEEPRVIFEVLSPETERIDRGEKLGNYQAIPSLDVYALVDQFHIAVTVYRRTGNDWAMQFLSEKTDVLDLPSIECALRLADIYDRTHLMR